MGASAENMDKIALMQTGRTKVERNRGTAEMNTWTEYSFPLPAEQACSLYYCGKREKSVSHTYGPYQRTVYLLNYVKEGCAVFCDRTRRYHVHEGQFYVLFPESGVCYQTDAGRPWSILWIVADGALLADFLRTIRLTPQEPVMSLRFPEKIETILGRIFEKTQDGALADSMTCLSLMYELFAHLAAERELAPLETAIGASVRYMEQNLSRRISSEELACRAHLSKNYFIKLFKRQTNVTPQQLLDTLRIQKAAHLLKYSELSITEIAAAVGYDDPLYFSRRFRKRTGRSPSRFRAEEAI